MDNHEYQWNRTVEVRATEITKAASEFCYRNNIKNIISVGPRFGWSDDNDDYDDVKNLSPFLLSDDQKFIIVKLLGSSYGSQYQCKDFKIPIEWMNESIDYSNSMKEYLTQQNNINLCKEQELKIAKENLRIETIKRGEAEKKQETKRKTLEEFKNALKNLSDEELFSLIKNLSYGLDVTFEQSSNSYRVITTDSDTLETKSYGLTMHEALSNAYAKIKGLA